MDFFGYPISGWLEYIHIPGAHPKSATLASKGAIGLPGATWIVTLQCVAKKHSECFAITTCIVPALEAPEPAPRGRRRGLPARRGSFGSPQPPR